MQLLVTGGAGFIGSNFVRMVVDGELAGIDKLTVLDKLTYAGNLENFSGLASTSFDFIQGDICNKDMVRELMCSHDAVINFAAESHVDRSISDSINFTETNVLGTHVLLDAALASGVEVFLQVSTDEVYGSIVEGSWDEAQPLLPNSPYAASKAAADLLARAYFQTYGLDIRITRCSNNYGPRQYPEKLIPLFITNLLEGENLPIYGDGKNIREWIHVKDHCRGLHAALFKGKAGEIYNLGSGIELSNLEITDCLLRNLGFDKTKIEYVEDRLGHDHRYSLNTQKSQESLDFKTLIKWEDGILETIEWYQKNNSWWKPLKK